VAELLKPQDSTNHPFPRKPFFALGIFFDEARRVPAQNTFCFPTSLKKVVG
jgi:hypothetical protein